MNNGIAILSGILALFFIGTFCLIMDTVTDKSGDEVYIRVRKKVKPEYLIEEENTESNIFNEE